MREAMAASGRREQRRIRSGGGGDIVVAMSGRHWLQEVYHLSSAQSWSIAGIMGNAESVIEPGCSSREVKRTGGTGAGVTRAVTASYVGHNL